MYLLIRYDCFYEHNGVKRSGGAKFRLYQLQIDDDTTIDEAAELFVASPVNGDALDKIKLLGESKSFEGTIIGEWVSDYFLIK